MPGFPVLYIFEFAKTHAHWVGDAIQPSHFLFPFSCPQSFPSSGYFPMSWLFTSGGQSIGASASFLPMNTQDWSPLGWTGWISVLSKGLSRVFSTITVQKHQFFGVQHSLRFNSHLYMTTGKTIALTIWVFVGKVTFLLFNTLSRFVIAFLPRSKCLWISWLQSPSAMILEPRKIKSITLCTFSPYICHEVMTPDAMLLVFWMLSFKTVFSLSFSSSSRGSEGTYINII